MSYLQTDDLLSPVLRVLGVPTSSWLVDSRAQRSLTKSCSMTISPTGQGASPLACGLLVSERVKGNQTACRGGPRAHQLRASFTFGGDREPRVTIFFRQRRT
jgi:hypothetical protein